MIKNHFFALRQSCIDLLEIEVRRGVTFNQLARSSTDSRLKISDFIS